MKSTRLYWKWTFVYILSLLLDVLGVIVDSFIIFYFLGVKARWKKLKRRRQHYEKWKMLCEELIDRAPALPQDDHSICCGLRSRLLKEQYLEATYFVEEGGEPGKVDFYRHYGEEWDAHDRLVGQDVWIASVLIKGIPDAWEKKSIYETKAY